MSTLTILYKHILANASKALNLPAIEDETQVRRQSKIFNQHFEIDQVSRYLENCSGLSARSSNRTQTHH